MNIKSAIVISDNKLLDKVTCMFIGDNAAGVGVADVPPDSKDILYLFEQSMDMTITIGDIL